MMKEKFWVAPILTSQQGAREWSRDIDAACQVATHNARETGNDYEVYRRAAYVTPQTLKFFRPAVPLSADEIASLAHEIAEVSTGSELLEYTFDASDRARIQDDVRVVPEGVVKARDAFAKLDAGLKLEAIGGPHTGPGSARRQLAKILLPLLNPIEAALANVPPQVNEAVPSKWNDVSYLMSIIDSAIEDGFDPDEDGPLLDEIRAELNASPSPGIATAGAQCCMCGKTGLSTVEGDGGPECQLEDGRWTCSGDCYYRATDDTPSDQSGEPAAWRFRYLMPPDRIWTVCSDKPPEDAQSIEVQPLYAAPSEQSRVERLETALEEIARQKLSDESEDQDGADWLGGYDACVNRARQALGDRS